MDKSILGYLAALLTAIIWGIPCVFGKSLDGFISIEVLVLSQYVLASLTVGLFILFRFRSSKKNGKMYTLKIKSKRDFVSFAAGGIIGQYAFSILSFYSLSSISAPENGIIQALIPIFILAIGTLFYKENFTRSQIISSFFAFFGVGLLIFGTEFVYSKINSGHFVCLISSIFFAVCAHDRERLTNIYGPVVTMFYQFLFALIAAIFFFSFSKASLSDFVVLLSYPEKMFMLVSIGVGVSGLSYLLYAFSIQCIGASRSGVFLNIIPISSFILSVVLLGEEVTKLKLLGIALVTVSMIAFKYLSCSSSRTSSPTLEIESRSFAR